MAPIRVGVNSGTGKIYANVTLSTLGRGHFNRHGLDVELVELGGRRVTIPLLARDELEVTSQGPTYEFFSSWDPEHPMTMVADHGSAREGRGGAGGIVARPELVRSGVLRDFKDLRGKRVALSPRRYDHDWVTIGAALKLGGLTVDDIDVVTMDFGAVRHDGLVNGTLDVTTVDRPASIKEAKESGAFVVWKYEYEVRPGRQQRTVMFGPRFASERPDEAQRYVTAYLEGLREYYDAFEHNVDRDAILDVLARECGDSRDVVEATPPAGLDPDGHLNTEGIAEELRWYQEGGFLPWTISLDRVVDESFLDHALTELGPYRAPDAR